MVHISLTAEKLFDLFGLPVTNTLLTAWVVLVLLVLIGYALRGKIKTVPGKLQNVVEFIIETFLDFMTTVAGSRKDAEKFFPIVATVFFFILFSNWMGIVPGVGSIGLYHTVTSHTGEVEREFVPYLRSVNSDLNMTLALALIIVTLSHYFGVATLGAGKHVSKFFNFRKPVDFFVGILEFISEFAKIISFSFRLFGNVFAGEVLLVIMTFLVPYVAPVPFYGLEMFVGFIQALIFAVLSMMFLSVATKHH